MTTKRVQTRNARLTITTYVMGAFISLSAMSCGSDGAGNASASGNTTETAAPKQEEAAMKVTAARLVKDYKDNEIAADNTYKEKTLEVSGVVSSIANDIMDNPYVTLSSGDEMDFESVQCVFSEKSVLASLKKGQKVTITGTGNGKMGNVLLEDCKLK